MAQWLPAARADATRIAAYYDAQRPVSSARPRTLGDEFLDALEATEQIIDTPPRGSAVVIPPDTRRALVRRPFGAYVVYYRARRGAVPLVIAVVHSARAPGWISNLIGRRHDTE